MSRIRLRFQMVLPWALPWLALLFSALPLAGSEVESFTEPYRDIEVAASEMGRLTAVPVREGDRVAAGQVLANLDDAALVAALRIAQVGEDSQARLAAAAAELELHEQSLARLEDLRQRQHASGHEIDRARLQRGIAQSRLEIAREELEIRKYEVARAQAVLAQRRVVSPIEGVVTRVHKDVGEFVSPSDPVVARVVQLDPLLVVFSVPMAHATKLAKGQRAEVTIAANLACENAEIEFVSPTPDAQSGTTRVRVRIANPQEKLPSGAACRLVLPESNGTSPAGAGSPVASATRAAVASPAR